MFDLKRFQCGFHTRTADYRVATFVAIIPNIPAPLIVDVGGRMENYNLDGSYVGVEAHKWHLQNTEFYDF